MVSSSCEAPSTSMRPRILSQACRARSLTVSKRAFAGISAARFAFAWSTLMREVARRRVTVRSLPGVKRA